MVDLGLNAAWFKMSCKMVIKPMLSHLPGQLNRLPELGCDKENYSIRTDRPPNRRISRYPRCYFFARCATTLSQETMSPIYHGKNQTSFNVKSLIKFRTSPLVQKWEQIQNLIQDSARKQKLRSKSEYVLRANSNYVLQLWQYNLIVIIFWLWFTLRQGVELENKI